MASLIRFTDATFLTDLQDLFDTFATSIEGQSYLGQDRPADLNALALMTTGNNVGDWAQVIEGGAAFQWNGSLWVQKSPATFASASARDAAYAKASGAFLVQGVQVRRTDFNWVEEYSTVYGSGNLAGRATAGWYPITVNIQRDYYLRYSGNASTNAAVAGSSQVFKRRPYKQRIVATWAGSFATTGPTVGALVATPTAGGTVIVTGGETVIVGGSGVIYSGIAVIEIAAGSGTDVTVSINSSFTTAVATGTVRYQVQVEGEW